MKVRANKQHGATIKDVAQAAGVSAMTVSRVLNSETNVRASTRERVLEAIAELNYKPNISARSLAKAQSFFIGLLYDNPSAGYISELLIGALNRCRREGYHLVLENCGSSDAEWERALEGVLRSSNFDGVIIPPPVCDYPAVLEAVREAGLPHVRMAPYTELDSAPYVRTDDRGAARRMTEYLIDLGHREIGFIRGHPEHGATTSRFDGFRDAIEARGLPMDKQRIVDGRFTYRSGLACAETLLASEDRPSAVFASNDDMAAAVIAIAHKYDLSVPGDLSVVGFDDTQTAITVWPQLTTVRQPIAEMASSAVELLASALDTSDDSEMIEYREIDCELVVRDSSGRPPAR